MSRRFVVLLLALLIFYSMQNLAFEEKIGKDSTKNFENDYTHFVVAELGSTTYCPYCPDASDLMHSLHSLGNLPFYYITLVYDKSDVAQRRGRAFNDYFIPMLYVDGGYKVVDTTSEISYSNAIKSSAERNVRDVDIEVNAEWNGNDVSIILNVTNNENRIYFGHIMVCMAEIDSRWIRNDGKHYNNTLMDYALNRYILIPGGKTKKLEVEWENKYNLQEGNTLILAFISNWIPHIQQNPWEKPKPNFFIAQFVDDANAAEI
ncbi:MAG TPA: hypothetical protein ENI33_07040 [Thermoplasmatales archaeon]|nr:hypothetical protein [Thermoplasmatales archaeon]